MRWEEYLRHGVRLVKLLKFWKEDGKYSANEASCNDFFGGKFSNAEFSREFTLCIWHRRSSNCSDMFADSSRKFGLIRVLLAPMISRDHFFLAVFVRVTHDGQSDRGTTRSLGIYGLFWYQIHKDWKQKVHVNRRITSRVFNVGFQKLRTACSWHFTSLRPLWDSFLSPFVAKCTQGT